MATTPKPRIRVLWNRVWSMDTHPEYQLIYFNAVIDNQVKLVSYKLPNVDFDSLVALGYFSLVIDDLIIVDSPTQAFTTED